MEGKQAPCIWGLNGWLKRGGAEEGKMSLGDVNSIVVGVLLGVIFEKYENELYTVVGNLSLIVELRSREHMFKVIHFHSLPLKNCVRIQNAFLRWNNSPH